MVSEVAHSQFSQKEVMVEYTHYNILSDIVKVPVLPQKQL